MNKQVISAKIEVLLVGITDLPKPLPLQSSCKHLMRRMLIGASAMPVLELYSI